MKTPDSSLGQDVLPGNSPEITQLRKFINAVSASDDHVMIYGETGTERQLVGELLHQNSQRANDPLITTEATRLNNAFEEELLNKIAKLDIPKDTNLVKGTLLIDSLEQLDQDAQNKLLPIAKKSYITIPGNTQPVQTDFRIIATTTPVILDEKEGTVFNKELFLILSSLTLKIPSLRERKQDIPIIFDQILKKICDEQNQPLPSVNFEVYNQLMIHNWPGNIKEMENTVRNMVTLSEPGVELDVETLPFVDKKPHFSKIELQNLNMAIAHLEEELISKALRRFAGNQSDAARVLCISETNLRYKMKKLGLKKNQFKPGYSVK